VKLSPLLHSLVLTFALAFSALAGKGGVGLSKISLPSGPGSIEGLGDSFEPQLNSGTSSYAVPMSIPPGVAGLQPNLSLGYNSGGGNGHFGLAWSCGAIISIQRQTEKGLPNYSSSDRFTLNGEELVLLSDGTYRTETEGGSRRIRRTSFQAGVGWEITDPNGTRHYLGTASFATNPSRLVRPSGVAFDDTFRWFVQESIDVSGNRMTYHYAQFSDSPGDTYLVEIRYSIFGQAYHSVSFDYEARNDIFSSYLSGFEVRTARRCSQIRILSQGGLVRRYRISYTLPADDPVEHVTPTDAGLAFSLIHQITSHDASPTHDTFLPPVRFGYTRLDTARVQRGSFQSPTGFSLADPNLSISDINCDSLPDLFFTDPLTGRHSVYFSQGLGRWSPERHFSNVPTGTTLDSGATALADYDGDGKIDLVQKVSSGTFGHFVYYPNTTLPIGNNELTPSWGPERAFATNPAFDLDDPSVRTLDLNGDKLLDAMRTTSLGFVYYYNRDDVTPYWEEDGLYLYGEAEMGDLSSAEAISFSDSQHVKLVDMNGDRLLDLVRIHVGNQPQPQLEITWWPNRGRGRWGNRVSVPTALPMGVVALEDTFFLDVNGDGLGDVASVAVDHVTYWINQGNGGYSMAFEIPSTPDYIKGQTVLTQADINGNGSTDFLWQNWDASAGAWRVSWVDFIGTEKPNLLKIIDNGIGLQTEMTYRTTTDYYVAALLGTNPWTTRLPFPSWCAASSTQRFGLDLDAVAGEDAYVTQFSYYNGYYDAQEREFRGFAFARKVELGDDRLHADGTPTQAEMNSPSTVTRMAYHTGVPDGIDNDGDNQVDERDALSGYEEEALKGTLLWTETTRLTAECDGLDSDGDGFIDEADEGPGSARLAPDDVVFVREYQHWALKTLYDGTSGISQPGLSLPYTTQNHQHISLPYMAVSQRSVIEACGSLHAAEPFASGVTTVTTRAELEVDLFGRTVVQRDYGITGGGALTYDDERITYTTYAYRPDIWIMGVPTEVRRTDENGIVASRQRSYYDDLAYGLIGSRGLVTASEDFLLTSSQALTQPSAAPGDPRLTAQASIIDRNVYDSFGNIRLVQDAAFTGPGGGHEREYTYDPVFHTYVERETLRVGNGKPDLVAESTYHYGSGAVTGSTDFNGNHTVNVLDSFFRAVALVEPGDSLQFPTKQFSYHPGDRVRGIVYNYDATGHLTVSVSAQVPVVSRVETKSRETAGGGTFDSITYSDGAGHGLGRVDEGERPDQWIMSEISSFTSRGAVREVFRPFYGSEPAYAPPPPDGARLTHYYDATGRTVRRVNPPEDDTVGSPRRDHRYLYLPYQTVSFDEGDVDPTSPHFGTPKIAYRDGFGRLLRIDELNREGAALRVYSTRYEYNIVDALVRTQDSQNNVKWMRYDGLKRLIAINDPDRGLTQFTYDLASNPIRRIDAKGQVIEMVYDGMNRLLTEDYLDARGLSPDVAFTYDTPVTVPAGDGTMVTNSNTKGRTSSITDLSGAEVTSYDARERVVWQIKRVPDAATGQLVSYQSKMSFDSSDRVIRTTYPDNDHVDYAYNTRSLPSSISGGPTGSIVSRFSYNAPGRLVQTDYGNGVRTNFRYDPRLRVRGITTLSPQLGKLLDCVYTLDSSSQLTRIDDNRPVASIPTTDPRRNTQVFAYDDLYRLQSVTYPALRNGQGGEITYRHDQIGNIVEQNSSIVHSVQGRSVTHLGSMSYGGTSGASGRMGRANGQPGPHALSHVAEGARDVTYDANGNVVTQDGLTQTWDFKDRLIVAENAEMRAEYTYDHLNIRITKRVTDKRHLPSGGLPSPEITHYISPSYEVRPGQELVKYVWSGNSRVARVTATLHEGEQLQRFSLRAGWNVLALAVTLTDGAGQFFGSTVDQVMRWVAASGEYFRLGANETVPAGTVLRVHTTEATALTLRGLRVVPAAQSILPGRQWVLNTRTTPLDLTVAVPSSDPLWFFEATSQMWSLRVPTLSMASTAPRWLQPGEAAFTSAAAAYTLATPDPSLSIRYYHADHLGSASVITDAAGTLVSEAAYYPFGQPRHEFTPRVVKTDYGFAQKERDAETGLSQFEARYLNSVAGRFISVDPVLAYAPATIANSPQRQNLYAYCQSSPLNCIDPSGCFDVPLSPPNRYVDITGKVTPGSVEVSLEVGVGQKVGSVILAAANIKGSLKVDDKGASVGVDIAGASVIGQSWGRVSLVGADFSKNLTTGKTSSNFGFLRTRLAADTQKRDKESKSKSCTKTPMGEICVLGKVTFSVKGMTWDPMKTNPDGSLAKKNYCGAIKAEGTGGLEIEGSPTPGVVVIGSFEIKSSVAVEICTRPPWAAPEGEETSKPNPTLNAGSACGTSHHQRNTSTPMPTAAQARRFEGLLTQP
jgi:RHS repeat-associated protein